MERINYEIWRPLGHVDLPKRSKEEYEMERQKIIAQARAEGLI